MRFLLPTTKSSAQPLAGDLHSAWAVIPAGQAIGNYRILSKIGTGGMGVVYLAEHPLIGKKVALKVIHSDLATQREVVQRFFQEAWAVNKIGDEHIVEIHDFGVTPDGDHFYIMEFLEGISLANVIARGPLDVVRALHIGAQMASALAAAHGAGVMHRDLKPDNIMLTTRLGDSDFVKLLDFGLAKIFIGADASAVQTAAGILLGTPQYMSPEACESRGNVDQRTDIYALGILLFQMLTGVVPFDGESVGEVLVKQVTQLPPPLRGFNPSIPPSVEQIALRCLMKAPDKRFSSMLELRAALLDPEAYLRSGPPIVPARALKPGEASAQAKTIVAHVTPDANAPDAGFETASGAAAESMVSAEHSHAVENPSRRRTRSGSALGTPPLSSPAHTMVIQTPVGYVSHAGRGWPVGFVVALLLVIGGGLIATRIVRKSRQATAEGLALASESNSAGWMTIANASPGSGLDSARRDAGLLGADSRSPNPDSQSADSAMGLPADISSDAGAAPGAVAVSDAGAGAAFGAGTAAGAASGAGTAVGAVAVSGAGSGSRPASATSDPRSDGSGSDPGTTAALSSLATVVIDSVPRGADVIGSDRKVLGKTPAKLQLPITSDTVHVELRLAGYHTRTKQFVVTGNAVIGIPLDRISFATHGEKRNSVRQLRRSSDDLERP